MNGRDRDRYDRTVDRDRDRHRENRYRGFEHSGERKNFERFDRTTDRNRGGNMDGGPYEDRYRGFEHSERLGDRYGNRSFESTDRYRHHDLERFDRPGYSKRDREQDLRDYSRSERPRHSHHQREYEPSPKRHVLSVRAEESTGERSAPSNHNIPATALINSQHQYKRTQRPEHEETQNQGQLAPHEAPSTSRAVVENRNVAGARKDNRPLEERILSNVITTRPEGLKSKLGMSGVRVSLITNHYRLLQTKTWQLYQYRVDFSPEIEIISLKKRLILEQKELFGNYLFVGSMLFLTIKLQKDIMNFMSKDREDNPIQTTVKFVGLLPKGQSMNILNSILRQSMAALQMQLVGRNYYDAVEQTTMRGLNLQLWPGYITSIRHHEHDVLMLAEISNKVMRTDTIYDILRKCVCNRDDYKRSFENQVLGMIVLTEYNNKSYRIAEIDYNSNPNSTFTRKGDEISYVDYYRQKYNIQIRDVNQPLLIHKSSDRDVRGGVAKLIALVPELCRATGLSEDMRNNSQQMKEFANHTRSTPSDRLQKLEKLNRRLHQNVDSMNNLKKWNLELEKSLVRLDGRRLLNERIMFKESEVETDKWASWSKALHIKEMFVSQHLENWVLTYPHNMRRQVEQFVDTLQRAARGMKYKICNPHYYPMNDEVKEYSRAINEAANRDPQLIMCIVSNSAVDRYSVIKKKCYLERGIPNQIVLAHKIKQGSQLMSICTNIVIQINSKLGGTPWMVNTSHSGLMVVGFDVYHDTSDKGKSYGAIVATMQMNTNDKPYYFSTVTPHKDGQDISSGIALDVSKAVKTLAAQHGILPSKIVMYRDGIGEGQIEYLLEIEVKAIRSALKQIYNGDNFKLTFFVVAKKINTKFFQNGINPQPGTVVDDVVTLPERLDFFLVSQSVRQGTASPTNYNVIYTNMGLTPDELQLLTYKMTHLYYNWSGTLRVPAVCHYAHRLAYLVGNYIHASPSHLLEKQLYFL